MIWLKSKWPIIWICSIYSIIKWWAHPIQRLLMVNQLPTFSLLQLVVFPMPQRQTRYISNQIQLFELLYTSERMRLTHFRLLRISVLGLWGRSKWCTRCNISRYAVRDGARPTSGPRAHSRGNHCAELVAWIQTGTFWLAAIWWFTNNRTWWLLRRKVKSHWFYYYMKINKCISNWKKKIWKIMVFF